MYLQEGPGCSSSSSLSSSVMSSASVAPFRLPYMTTSELAYSIERRAPSPCLSQSDAPRLRGQSSTPTLHRSQSLSNFLKRSPSASSRPQLGRCESPSSSMSSKPLNAAPFPSASTSFPAKLPDGTISKHLRTASTPNVVRNAKQVPIRPSTATSKGSVRNWSRPSTRSLVALPLSSNVLPEAPSDTAVEENGLEILAESFSPLPEKQRSIIWKIAQRWRRLDSRRGRERSQTLSETSTREDGRQYKTVAKASLSVVEKSIDDGSRQAKALPPLPDDMPAISTAASPLPASEGSHRKMLPIVAAPLATRRHGKEGRSERGTPFLRTGNHIAFLDMDHTLDQAEECLDCLPPCSRRDTGKAKMVCTERAWHLKDDLRWPQHFYQNPKPPLQHSFARCLATSGWTVSPGD